MKSSRFCVLAGVLACLAGCGSQEPAAPAGNTGAVPAPRTVPPAVAEASPAAREVEQVATAFLEAWQQTEFPALQQVLTQQAAARLTEQSVFWFGAGASYRLGRTQVEGETARVRFTTVSTISNGNEGQAILRLRRQAGAWRVADVEFGGPDPETSNTGLAFAMTMNFEASPLQMPYGNQSPEGEIEWQPSGDAFPPIEARQPLEDVAWTTDINSLQFPDAAPAAGQLAGQPFQPDTVRLRECGLGVWELTLQVGEEEFFPEQSVQLLLHLNAPQVPAGVTCQVAGPRTGKEHRAQVALHAKADGAELPDTKIFHHPLLNLQFDQSADSTLPGRLYLCVPDKDRSFVAGEFVAAVERQGAAAKAAVPKVRPPVPDTVAPDDPDAVRALLLAQQSDDTDFTTRTIARIVPMGAAVVPTLIELLRDKDPFVRAQAARCLRDLGPIAEPAVPALIETLADKQTFVPKQAALALGAIGPAAQSAGPALIELIGQGDMFSLEEAADALLKVGADTEPAVPVLLQVIRRGRTFTLTKSVVALQRMEADLQPAVPPLLNVLRRGNSISQMDAAEALGEIGPPARKAGPSLLTLLKTSDAHDRVVLAKALSRIGVESQEAVAWLLQTLEREDTFGRSATIEALGQFGPAAAPAVPLLIELAAAGSFDGAAAIGALGRMGPAAESAIPTLVDIANSGEFPNDGAAVEALGHIGPAAVPALVKLLEGERDPARAAVKALAALGPTAETAIGPLKTVALSGRSFIDSEAVQTLGAIGPAAVPALVDILQSKPAIGTNAAQVLGRLGPAAQEALPALRMTAQSTNARLAQASQEAIAQIEAASTP